MLPLEYYREQCQKGLIVEDTQQLKIVQELELLHHALVKEQQKRTGIFALFRQPRLVQGLYVWGGVGIGKTYLLDCFYHCLPFQNKLRMHFHLFMQWIHQELKNHQGKKDPLKYIAKELAEKAILLCFDELMVSDITDAMLLRRLFDMLFLEGVCLVATSNVIPDDLYKDGLQRKLFLPAIALLKQNTKVIHLSTFSDYRLRHLKDAGVFYTPNDEIATENMEKSFNALTNGMVENADPIEIYGRTICIKKQAGNTIWFDFDAICAVPRSQHDYLAIAQKYDTVFISDVPFIHSQAKDRIALFIRMIDVFYDARVRLVLSAETLAENIYSHGHMMFEFKRTLSRLLEMQSEAYFLSR